MLTDIADIFGHHRYLHCGHCGHLCCTADIVDIVYTDITALWTLWTSANITYICTVDIADIFTTLRILWPLWTSAHCPSDVRNIHTAMQMSTRVDIAVSPQPTLRFLHI